MIGGGALSLPLSLSLLDTWGFQVVVWSFSDGLFLTQNNLFSTTHLQDVIIDNESVLCACN